MDTWHDVGHTSNLSLSWDKRGIRAKRAHFLVLIVRERRREKEVSQGFLPRSTEFRWSVFIEPRTKVHRVVHVSTKKEGFRRSSKKGDFGNSRLSGLGGFLPVYHAPRGKRFFLPWLTFHFWARKSGFFN